MSSIDPSGTSRPLRIAGVALLCAAGLAAVIGVATLTAGSSTPDAAAGPSPSAPAAAPPPATSSVPSTLASSPSPTAISSAPPVTTSALAAPSSVPSEIPPIAGPPGGAAQPGGGQSGGGQSVSRPDVRVYNNSTIKGLATRAADDFRAAGWNVPEVGNYPGGVLATTTVFFRPGTPEEAAAHELADSIQARAEPRFAGIQDASPGVIVIVTNDYKGYQSK